MKKIDETNGTYKTNGTYAFFLRPIGLIGLIGLIGPILFSTIAHAQTTPSPVQTSIGTACTGKANSADFDAIAQCNGTTMQRAPVQIGQVTAPTPYATATCNADKAGMIQWNGHTFQACDGTTWMKIPITLYDPSCDGDNPAIGTICDDGTVYVGKTPDGNIKMFATPCDEGMTWDEATKTCTGTRMALTWQTGPTGVVTGVTNPNTGQANTAALVAKGTSPPPAPYLAAQRCDQSMAFNRTDWYLPAIDELYLSIISLSSIGLNNGLYGIYLSSTEANADNVHSVDSAYGVQKGTISKDNALWFVRCVRKG